MNLRLMSLALTLTLSSYTFAEERIGQEFRTLKKFPAQGIVFPASRQENKDIFCYLGVGDLEGKFKPKESSPNVLTAEVLPSGSIVKLESVKKVEASRTILIKFVSESEKIQIAIQCRPKQVGEISEIAPPEFEDVLSLFADQDLSR